MERSSESDTFIAVPNEVDLQPKGLVDRWSALSAVAKWISGILATIITTVAVGLIQDVIVGGEDAAPPPATQAADVAADDQETTVPERDGEAQGRLILTTSLWDEGSGWVEHASWATDTVNTDFHPVISAWNWLPDYPALTVRFDDFTTTSSSDDFNGTRLSTVWQYDASAGATATLDDGHLLVEIEEGTTSSSHEKRVDLFHGVTVSGDFEVSVSFVVDDNFHSLTAGGLSLSIVPPGGTTEDFQTYLMVLGNSYLTDEYLGDQSRTIAASNADELSGKLRIRGTYVGS